MDTTQQLETEKISKLLWIYAWPAIISQIISSVYNICDRVFLGQYVGAMAIAGLAITMPVMNIIHAFGSLVGAGSSARMSIVLGRKDIRWAEKILGNSLLLTFFFGFIFVLGGYLFMEPILHLFGASDGTIAYAQEYMDIVLPGMFFVTLTFNLTGLMRATGYPTKAMLILAGGAILNILLDALFIIVLDWGIAGAAWATTVSMFASSLFAVAHFIPRRHLSTAHPKVNRFNFRRPVMTATLTDPSGGMSSSSGSGANEAFICFRRHAWAPKLYIFRNILAIGISPFSMNVAGCAVVALLNSQLIRYGGDLAVGANGIVNSATLIILMLFLGICQGMQPIAGYNYGAGHQHRLKEIYLLTMKVTLLIAFVGTLVVLLFPEPIIRCFTTDDAMVAIAIPAMRYLIVLCPLIGYTVVNSQFFQSIDSPWIAIVTSLSRQVLFLIPMMFIVPSLFVRNGLDGLTGVWVSCTICDFLGAALSTALLLTQLKVFRPGYVAPERKPRKEHGPQ
ncbi:MAG: MATE family efflux transporter [Bacteroidales bacterium]|nr:MATE family efflux transporter [Bacteroidales bacterium]